MARYHPGNAGVVGICGHQFPGSHGDGTSSISGLAYHRGGVLRTARCCRSEDDMQAFLSMTRGANRLKSITYHRKLSPFGLAYGDGSRVPSVANLEVSRLRNLGALSELDTRTLTVLRIKNGSKASRNIPAEVQGLVKALQAAPYPTHLSITNLNFTPACIRSLNEAIEDDLKVA